jgi:Ca2+-binding RTX toxin-like protein
VFSVNTATAGNRLENLRGAETIALTANGVLATSFTVNDTFLANNNNAGKLTFTASTNASDTSPTVRATAAIDASALSSSYAIAATFTSSSGTGAATMTGGAGNDELTGSKNDDSLTGGGGADTIVGNAGSDTISGGDGADRLNGGVGIDVITGGAGNDIIIVNAASTSEAGDVVSDFTAGDRILVTGTAQGNNTFDLNSSTPSAGTYTLGNAGVSFRLQNNGLDFVATDLTSRVQLGESATNSFTLAGSGHNVTAGGFNDYIIGDSGNDTISGGAGDDTLQGAGGSDTITGGGGVDVLTGGAAGDTFVYTSAAGAGRSTLSALDQITDLTINGSSADRLDIDVAGSAAVVGSAAQNAGVALSGLTETVINNLLNTTSGTLTSKFAGSTNTSAALLTTTDTSAKTILVIDIDGGGTFTTANDLVIDVTGVTLTSWAAGFMV